MGDIKATPRNKGYGLLADIVGGLSEFGSKPFGYDNPPVRGLLELASVPALARTLNELSYGGALGTGSGMTWKPKTDTVDAAMLVAPMIAKAPEAINATAAAVGKRIEPAVARMVTNAMERGGMPAQLLQDMSNKTISPATVWHASPFKFDKFSTTKSRAGEGGASYGHGLYVAESPEVSGIGGKYFEQFKRHEAAKEQGGPFSYKVDIPDDSIAKMLDWDKPLAQQNPEVRKAITSLAQSNPEIMEAIQKGGMGDMKGSIFYSALQDLYTGNAKRKALVAGENPAAWTNEDIARLASGNDAWASEQLHKTGIPGLKYLDAGSRDSAAGTSNYVVFPGNESLLTILERNGQPLENLGLAKKPFVYPQEQALLTAQKNAALPIEKGGLGLPANNTPMDRARAMGMEDVFHGSKSPEGIDNLVAGGREGAIRHGDAYGTGVYTTTDAVGDASSYGAGGAVFPLKLDRGNHLQIDAPNANDLQKLSKFSGDAMLPSDKARFSIGRETRQFKDVQDARDFFANQRENWKQFGDGMDRAKPEAIANPDGTFAVQFTNFDAPVPITNGKEADTMFRALGYDNIPSLGYSGHTLDRGAGRLWDITSDTSKLRSRFAAFDPLRRHEANLLAGAIPFSVMVDQRENLGLGR